METNNIAANIRRLEIDDQKPLARCEQRNVVSRGWLVQRVIRPSYAQKLSRIFFRTLDVQENENGDKVIQYCYKGIEKTSSLYCKLIEFSESARHFQ